MIEVGNFIYESKLNSKGQIDWIYKSKDIVKKPEKVVEPIEYKLLSDNEKTIKDNYSQTLVQTVKEIIIFLKDGIQK